jgi:hypothetical protein
MDVPTVSVSSGRKRALSSSTSASSTGKRLKNASDLPQHQLIAFNNKMDQYSHLRGWHRNIDDAGKDLVQWRTLSSDVLVYLTNQLAATDLKADVITFLLPHQAADLVDRFSQDEFSTWMDGVKKGVKMGDWTHLINHRAYHPAYMF